MEIKTNEVEKNSSNFEQNNTVCSITLSRRLEMWLKGQFDDLFDEAKALHQKIPNQKGMIWENLELVEKRT